MINPIQIQTSVFFVIYSKIRVEIKNTIPSEMIQIVPIILCDLFGNISSIKLYPVLTLPPENNPPIKNKK